MTRRPGFLTIFFVALGIAFAVMVFLRIRSYQTEQPAGSTRTSPDPIAKETEGKTSATDAVAIDTATTSSSSANLTGDDFELVPVDPPQQRIPLAQPTASAPPAIAAAASATSATPLATADATASASGRVVPRSASVSATNPAVPANAQPAQPQPQPSTQPTPASDTPKEPDPPAEEKDPTSDSQGPQLAFITFTPAQVADGEETTLVVQATDDLSGIRSISGTIIAPSGAVQGFACTREGDTNRFVARVIIPKEAAEGVWSVNYVNLMDNASNATAITAARGGLPPSASFRVVSSRPDSQGPTLASVWVDRRAMRGGEKNTVFVRADDDKAGVNLVSGIFQSPSRQARVGFVCRSTGDGLWTCEMSAPSCADCGAWQLEQLQMQDKANNMTTLRAAQNQMIAAVSVDISSEQCDATPPALQSIALDRPVVSNIEQSAIGVTVRLTDDGCGVLSVSGQASGPPSDSGGSPPRLYFSFTATAEPSQWAAKLIVPRLAAKGVWRISFLQVLDRGQNLKTYTQNDPLLSGVTFVVE